MAIRVVMIGTGSAFTVAIAKTLVKSDVLRDCEFVLMDIDAPALERASEQVGKINNEAGGAMKIKSTINCCESLEDADFVVTSCAPQRNPLWLKDIEIAARHGVQLQQGENGGPAGQIHALRNITILDQIVRDMNSVCPDAWLLNFVNPMSILCTYFERFTSVKYMGFCHQVHGTFGLIAELLGMEPGDLQVVSAGINHMNFLLDIRKKGTRESYMDQFLAEVRQNKYWQKVHKGIPDQVFTLEFLDTFGIYPIGYDNHIGEYMQFFYTQQEWKAKGLVDMAEHMHALQGKINHQTETREITGTIDDLEVWRQVQDKIPFPKDMTNPYYQESPVKVMESLLTGVPLYLDGLVIPNRRCISNLPNDAIVDIPAIIVGGKAHGISVGELPFFAAELCPRAVRLEC